MKTLNDLWSSEIQVKLPSQLKTKIQRLFDGAKDQWEGVFSEYATFELSDSHLSVCVSSLQDVKLFNSNLQIVDEAFEYLVNKSAKGEKGQYFTPRHVIDMCVKMLNPKRCEYMIDTAAGSCGFPVHTFFKLPVQISPIRKCQNLTNNMYMKMYLVLILMKRWFGWLEPQLNRRGR